MAEDFFVSKEKVEWEKLKFNKAILELMPVESVEKYKFAPFSSEGGFVDVAVIDVNDPNTQNALRFFAGRVEKKIRVFPLSNEEFDIILKKYKDPDIEINKALETIEKNFQEEQKTESVKKKVVDRASVIQEAPVSKMVEVILKNAIDGKASDIHIEPSEDKVRVRYRVDGVLYNSIFLPQKIGPAVVSRIKILSNLKIDEKRKPQDGRFRIDDLGNAIDFRVSTFPVSHGEKVVMRILDRSQGLIGLEDLGMKGRDLDLVRKVIKEPFGIILVTGPTGSGKSTTLYSVLRMLNNEGVNIVTLEDPVEYMVDGVSQSQVRPEIDYTFASGLRSILRQDPDIIMVGEIRDAETAELAIHAALTGHLVLSTLHTNTAVGAIPRLFDMGIQPFLLSSSLKLVIGQRLVRKICSGCKKKREEMPEAVLKMIKKDLGGVSDKVLDDMKISRKDIESGNVSLYQGEGCPKCLRTGMKGRMGIFETLEVDEKVNQLINKRANEDEIEKVALEKGFTKMKQDGIIKVLLGATTIEEVQRVTEDDTTEQVIEAKGELN